MAFKRYLDAISASVKGSGSVFLQRRTKDIFTNNFNRRLMEVHKANHDLQIVVDQYACAQYVVGYLTKNESGMSKLLKAVNDQAKDIPNMDLINQLSSVLDKHREISIQESTYRILGLPMTKSSIGVKYLSTIHPHFRDGLLRGNIEDLENSESIFHLSPHQYYENRVMKCIEEVKYEEDEKEKCYWKNLTLAEFWSSYDIVYGENKRRIH